MEGRKMFGYLFMLSLLMINLIGPIVVSNSIIQFSPNINHDISNEKIITIRNLILINSSNTDSIDFIMKSINKSVSLTKLLGNRGSCVPKQVYLTSKKLYGNALPGFLNKPAFNLYLMNSTAVLIDEKITDNSEIKVIKTIIHRSNLTRSLITYDIKYTYKNTTIYTRIYYDPIKPTKTLFYISILTNNKYIISGRNIDIVMSKEQATLSEYYDIFMKLISKIYGNNSHTKDIEMALQSLSEILESDSKLYPLASIKGTAIGAIAPTSLSCDICLGLVWALCFLLSQGVAEWAACGTACAIVCSPWGWGAFVCYGVCYSVCDTVLYWILTIGIGTACGAGGSYVCHLALGC